MEDKLKKKRVLIWGSVISCFLLITYVFYVDQYSNEGILKNVIDRDGYTLKKLKDDVAVELFIEPEWIPFHTNVEQKMDIILAENDNTNIHLVEVWNRGNDIYFSFDTTYNLDYNRGKFLYNVLFNEDGSFTHSSSSHVFTLYTKDGVPIEWGQSGVGPNSAFGVAVDDSNYDLIKNGFYIKYSGFYLYEYEKN